MAKQAVGKAPAPSLDGIIQAGGRNVVIRDPHQLKPYPPTSSPKVASSAVSVRCHSLLQ
jgi:hypothetical protein